MIRLGSALCKVPPACRVLMQVAALLLAVLLLLFDDYPSFS